MTPIEFLYQTWSLVCDPGDWVFLSTKENKWTDYPFRFDKQIKGKIRDWLRRHDPKELDVYFCPLPFNRPERLADNVKPLALLWSDVDDGDPSKVKPSILWESSPNRHHALWVIDEKMHPDDAAELNRAVTYYMGADKGGWDLSQVLRIPGTYNHKYDDKPKVKLIRWDDEPQDTARISEKVGHTFREKFTHEISDDAEDILAEYSISRKVLDILFGSAEGADRSDVLWYLNNKLNDAGLSPDEIITVLKQTEWNKYAGRRDEDKRLKIECEKVIEKKVEKRKERNEKKIEVKKKLDSKIETFSDMMGAFDSNPGWTCKDFWMKRSHGIVAGEPKSFKSTLVMDMALSLCSGTKFLGKYPCDSIGTVLYIQNENSNWIMKDRFEKMVKSKGLGGKVHVSDGKINVKFPQDLPFYLVNQKSFLLSDEDQCDWLEDTIEELKPELVILDPLYLMFDGDISSAKELFPILEYLLYLKAEYKTGIMVVHHYNKGGDSKRGGQRMLGSTTLHGWIESAWYLQSLAGEDGEADVVMDREFRGAGMYNKLDIRVKMGGMGDPTYNVDVMDHFDDSAPKKYDQDDAAEEVKALVEERIGITDTQIQKHTGYTMKQVRELVDHIILNGDFYRKHDKVYSGVEA